MTLRKKETLDDGSTVIERTNGEQVNTYILIKGQWDEVLKLPLEQREARFLEMLAENKDDDRVISGEEKDKNEAEARERGGQTPR